MSSAVDNIRRFLAALPDGVKLVAVTKTIPVDIINAVYDSGHKIFGENKVQELISKSPNLPDDIEWHMIGHLQSNKVKYIAPYISMIHSVDSLKLLRIINHEGLKNNRIINCLLQIYIAEEEAKFGLSFREAEDLISTSEFKLFRNIKICGLMGMATFTGNMDQVRKEFKSLVNFFHMAKNKYFQKSEAFREISMGMSGDYQTAIEEGATIIRVGSLIFGERRNFN